MKCIKCNKTIADDSVYCQYCGKKQEKPARKVKQRGNGQGTVYKLPSGKWRAEITLFYKVDGDKILQRKRKTKSGFKTKKEALAYLPILKNEKEQKEITVAEIYDIWSKSHFQRIGKSKQSSYRTAYKKIEPLYYRKISSIKLSDMQEIVDNIKGGFYPKHDVKVLLNQLFKYAMIEDYCTKNYAQFIKLPPLEKSKKDAFTRSEIATLWWDYRKGNKFTGYILIMIYTGMRYGEISTILKENINLEKRYMIGGIKTEAGKNREILIPKKIYKIVEEKYNQNKTKLLEMSEEDFYTNFNDTIKRLGLRPVLSPHCCRHTCATLMAQAGVHPSIIKEIMGHKNYSTTLGYTHISLKSKLDAANKI